MKYYPISVVAWIIVIRIVSCGLKAMVLLPLIRSSSIRAWELPLFRSYNKPMVFVLGFYDGTKFFKGKTQSRGEENSSSTVEEKV